MTRDHDSKVVGGRGGCDRCAAKWQGSTALAQAARHHDSTGHPTWAEQTVRTQYGGAVMKNRNAAEPRML